MKIYFDNVLLDQDFYQGFDINYKQFENEFFLGSTASMQASLVIPSDAFISTPNEVVIKIDDIDYLHLVVESIEETDNAEIKINLSDKMINTAINYDFSDLVPITAKELLENICDNFLIPHDEFNFTNMNIEIESYDNTVTAREYISMIAEAAGCYAYIDNFGKLKLETYLQGNRNLFDVNKLKVGYQATFSIIENGFSGTGSGYVLFPFEVSSGTYQLNYNYIVKSGNPSTNTGQFRLRYQDGSYSDFKYSTNEFIINKPLKEIMFYYDNMSENVEIEFTNIILKDKNLSPQFTISYDEVDTFKLGDVITIERIIYEFGARKYQSSEDESLYTVQLNPNNLFLQVATDEELNAIKNNIIGFSFSNISINMCNKFTNDKLLYFNDGEIDNIILNQFSASYGGTFIGSYETNINNTKEEFTKIINTEEKIRRINQTIKEDQLTITAINDDIGKMQFQLDSNGLLLNVLANDSNINVEYDEEGNPIKGTLQEVTTTNGLMFNKEGLLLFNDADDYVAQHTPTGTYYKDGDTILGQYTKEGSALKNLDLYGIYSYGKENIDESPLIVGQLYINENQEKGFGHFYNGGDI